MKTKEILVIIETSTKVETQLWPNNKIICSRQRERKEKGRQKEVNQSMTKNYIIKMYPMTSILIIYKKRRTKT